MSSTNSFELTQNDVNTFDAVDRETFATNGLVNLHLKLFVFATNYGGSTAWQAYDGKRNWLVDADGATADFHKGDSVTFTAKNAGTVTLSEDLQVPSMTVNGGEYTFEGDGSLYATDLTVSGQAEGTNVRYEVLRDDTSVRVSVTCDEESHPEPNPEPDPMPVPVP